MRPTRVSGAARPVTQPRRTSDRALRSTFATNMALAGLAVITGIPVARLLGPAGEGELTAIQTWPLLLGTLAMLGLDSAVVYFISRQPERGRQLTSTAVLIGLLSSLAVGAVAWFALPSLLLAQQPQVISAARVFLLVGVIYAIVGIPHGSLRGADAFTAWNLFRLAPGLAWLCILLTSWLLGHPTRHTSFPVVLGRNPRFRPPFPLCRKSETTGPLETRCQISARNVALRASFGSRVASADHQSPIGSAPDHRISPGSDTRSLCRRGGLEWCGRSAADSRGICPVSPRVC